MVNILAVFAVAGLLRLDMAALFQLTAQLKADDNPVIWGGEKWQLS